MLQIHGMDATFEEGKHPRAANGQFGSGGGKGNKSGSSTKASSETIKASSETIKADFDKWKSSGTLSSAASFASRMGVSKREIDQAVKDKDKNGLVILALRKGYGDKAVMKAIYK